MHYVLSPDQELQVAGIARQQGETCPSCKTDELVVEDIYLRRVLSGRMKVSMVCVNGCGNPVRLWVEDNEVGEMVPA